MSTDRQDKLQKACLTVLGSLIAEDSAQIQMSAMAAYTSQSEFYAKQALTGLRLMAQNLTEMADGIEAALSASDEEAA